MPQKQQLSTHSAVVEPAIEPRVDRVWHLIPGYDGIKQNNESISPLTPLHTYRSEPIYKGNTNKPMVAFLINVAWGEDYLPQMLHTLYANNVKATFFLDGQWLMKHKAEAKTILKAGHQLANHGYSHKNMSQLNRTQIVDEIQRTQHLLKQLGVTNNYLAPPSGDFDQESLSVTSQQGLFTILWTVDTIDWREKDARVILQRVLPRVESGTMILMHPTVGSSAALDELIKGIKQKKLKLGTVNEITSSARLKVE
jgi:probable sporulation protein (polysaccharide deacetylase family)